jgi:hypothetical protein
VREAKVRKRTEWKVKEEEVMGGEGKKGRGRGG